MGNPDQLFNFEIFKTNIQTKRNAEIVIKELLIQFPESYINIDLNDCDNVLRVEGNDFNVQRIKESLNNLGYICEVIN